MSQSSSASGSSSRGGGGPGYDGQGSPVPYRVGPLAYEPAVLCDCKMKACKWISWSHGDPARRYYECSRAMTAMDCKFFEWADEDCSSWFKDVLWDLQDAVCKLKKVVANKEEEVEAKVKQLVAKQMELEGKNKEVQEKQMVVEAKQQELNAKHKELAAKQQQLQDVELAVQALGAKVKNQNQYIDALVLLCILLLIILVVVLKNAK